MNTAKLKSVLFTGIAGMVILFVVNMAVGTVAKTLKVKGWQSSTTSKGLALRVLAGALTVFGVGYAAQRGINANANNILKN